MLNFFFCKSNLIREVLVIIREKSYFMRKKKMTKLYPLYFTCPVMHTNFLKEINFDLLEQLLSVVYCYGADENQDFII